jgi:FkbM family methyltransferase
MTNSVMDIIKRFGMNVFWQICVRKNLCHLRDWRAFAPFLNQSLFEAARTWPEVLPWKPRSILDIGANMGEITEQLVQLYHPMFVGLVEPLPQMVALLEKKSLAPMQKVFPCALGRKEGKATLNVLTSLTSSSLLEVTPGCDDLFHRSMERIDTLEVPVRTLDWVFTECGLTDLDLLKVDVQGYEIEVFAGGIETLKRTRLIVTEVSFFEHYRGQPLFGQVYSKLREMGFELKATFGYSLDDQGLPLQCDALFINRAMPTRIEYRE